jgi:hypothetical protein
MKKIFFISILAITFFSCKKNSSNAGNNPASGGGGTVDTIGTVYAAGHDISAATSKNVATYWRGSTAVRLTDASKDAYATGITKVGNDIYVCGYEANGSSTAIVKYWKNTTAVNLTDGTKQAYAGGIVVVGTDVYVAGYEFNAAGKSVAKYWKNGTAVNLSDGVFAATAKAIAISGTDVYVTGYEANAAGKSVAKYWKNGTAVNLTDAVSTFTTSAIAVNGTDVYVTGTNFTPAGFNQAYWKNGALSNLPASTLAEINSVLVNQGSVYVGGSVGQKATYWKDGIAFPLENNLSATEYITSIFVLAGKVYCGGYRSYFGAGGVAFIWSFGSSTQLSSYASQVKSIYVVN